MLPFVSGFFPLGQRFQGSGMLWHVSELHAFLWLTNILTYGYTTFVDPFSS